MGWEICLLSPANIDTDFCEVDIVRTYYAHTSAQQPSLSLMVIKIEEYLQEVEDTYLLATWQYCIALLLICHLIKFY